MIALSLLIACKGGEAPSSEDVTVVDLGSQTVGADGYTGDIDVEVPDGAISALAYCGGYGDFGLGALGFLTDPGGTQVWDLDNPDTSKFRSDYLDDTSTVMLPVSPNLDISAGTWKFNWYVEPEQGKNALDCQAAFRVDTASPSPTIFVDLVFVSVAGLDSSSAQDDANFQSVLSQVESEWGSQGITPTWNYSDFSGDVSKFGVVDVSDDDFSEFNDLLRTANPSDSRTLTFFLVDEIADSSGGGSTILGLSGGPPGAGSFGGTSKSGVIVSTADLATAPEDVGRIMAHEGGHYLGLYHTVEKDGSDVDPLDDTPVCTTDADANGELGSDECAGNGPENVMWWSLTTGDQSFTADQAWVVARNPVAD